jgi:hypothetical protein
MARICPLLVDRKRVKRQQYVRHFFPLFERFGTIYFTRLAAGMLHCRPGLKGGAGADLTHPLTPVLIHPYSSNSKDPKVRKWQKL